MALHEHSIRSLIDSKFKELQKNISFPLNHSNPSVSSQISRHFSEFSTGSNNSPPSNFSTLSTPGIPSSQNIGLFNKEQKENKENVFSKDLNREFSASNQENMFSTANSIHNGTSRNSLKRETSKDNHVHSHINSDSPKNNGSSTQALDKNELLNDMFHKMKKRSPNRRTTEIMSVLYDHAKGVYRSTSSNSTYSSRREKNEVAKPPNSKKNPKEKKIPISKKEKPEKRKGDFDFPNFFKNS